MVTGAASETDPTGRPGSLRRRRRTVSSSSSSGGGDIFAPFSKGDFEHIAVLARKVHLSYNRVE